MDTGIAIVGLLGLIALAKKALDFLRLLTNLPHTKSGVLTQALAWCAGLAAVFLYAASQLAASVSIPGTVLTLEDLDGATKVILGLNVGSLASIVTDFIQARDNSDSAAKPQLIPDRPEHEHVDE